MSVWNASAIEIVWTVIGAIGMGFGFHNMRDSRHTIVALRTMNGKTFAQHRLMRLLAYGHFRNDLLRFSAQLTITIVGIFSMVLPPSSQATTQHITYGQVVVTAGFFFIALEIVLASVLDKNQRDAMEEGFVDERREAQAG